MSFMFLPDYIKHAVASAPGTGNITLGAVVPGFQSLANSASPPASGSVVPYIANDSGNGFECGYATATLSGSTWTLSNRTPFDSSNGNGLVNLSSAAIVSITIFASDILNRTNKNVLRNPAMDIAQRGTSGSVAAAASVYTLDGWIISATGAAAAWSQQYSANIAGNALRISCATGLTAVTLSQRIESMIAVRLLTALKGAQTITLQAIISNQTASAITPTASSGYASARDNFGTVTADLAATNLQSIPAGGTGQVALAFVPNASLTNGYQINFNFGSALNASSGYIDISLIDLRVSPGIGTGQTAAAPSPELRPIDSEAAFCQRYFLAVPAAWIFAGASVAASGTGFSFGASFPVQMRAAPTASLGWTLSNASAPTQEGLTTLSSMYFAVSTTSGFADVVNTAGSFSAEL